MLLGLLRAMEFYKLLIPGSHPKDWFHSSGVPLGSLSFWHASYVSTEQPRLRTTEADLEPGAKKVIVLLLTSDYLTGL